MNERKLINLIHLHFSRSPIRFSTSIHDGNERSRKKGKKHDDKGATCIQSATNLTDPSRYKYSSNQRKEYPSRRGANSIRE